IAEICPLGFEFSTRESQIAFPAASCKTVANPSRLLCVFIDLSHASQLFDTRLIVTLQPIRTSQIAVSKKQIVVYFDCLFEMCNGFIVSTEVDQHGAKGSIDVRRKRLKL